jgi:hypothetical protein
MYFTNRAENRIPIRSSEICWCTKACNRISVGIGVIDHDIRCIIRLDLRSKILTKPYQQMSHLHENPRTHSMDLDMIVNILRFNGEEQGSEPLK